MINNESGASDPSAGAAATSEATPTTIIALSQTKQTLQNKKPWEYKVFWTSIMGALGGLGSIIAIQPWHSILIGLGIAVGCLGNLVPLFLGSPPDECDLVAAQCAQVQAAKSAEENGN